MKELLTKKFWRDVKRTFEDAQQETKPQADREPDPPAEAPKDVPAGDASPALSDTGGASEHLRR
jgi:hypothetical protein